MAIIKIAFLSKIENIKFNVVERFFILIWKKKKSIHSRYPDHIWR